MKLQVTIVLCVCISLSTGTPSNLQEGLKNLRLNTLLSLIESAGLVEALSGEGQLTLLAPTDSALKKFIDSLPNTPDTETVKKVLLNHVISGRVRAEDISDGQVVENLDGNKLTIRVNPTGVTVGGARVDKTNINVLRLTIHTLDDVINPFELGTLKEGLKGLGLNTLFSLIESTGLIEALSGEGQLTLFAPTDSAIKKFIDSLPNAPNSETVKKVLLNHVISGRVRAEDISDGQVVENLDKSPMTIRINPKSKKNPSGVTVGGARVARANIPVLRLTVHTLDDVINPFELGTLQEGLKGLGLNTLTTLLENADLVGALSGKSDMTLFAPTDKAIAIFIKSLPSAPDANTVKTVLLNHVISGKAMSGDISDGLTVKNLAGNGMTFRVTQGGVTIGGAKVVRTDVPVLSVTVHILDDVINPANLPGRR